MTTRDDATYLSLSERAYLTMSAIDMIEEGITAILDEAVEDGCDPDDEDLMDSLEDLRASSYASLLSTMTNSNDEAKMLVKLVRISSDTI